VPDQYLTLPVVDDATKHVLYAQLIAGAESIEAIMTALRRMLRTSYGIPGALYTDHRRGSESSISLLGVPRSR
jgi:hypothetical protein